MGQISSFLSAPVRSAPIASAGRPRKTAVTEPSVSRPRALGSPPLVACVTACNESLEELKFCLETFHGDCPADLHLDAIYVVLDGCPDEGMQGENETFQALVSLMDLHVPPRGVGVSIVEGGCRVYVGKVGSVPARVYVKGRGEFQRSKRRSIIAFYDILRARIRSGTSEEPLAVIHMDADTGSAEPGRENAKTSFGLENVARLFRIMRTDDNLGALATQVRVLHRTKNALSLMQSSDCNTVYVGLNGGTGFVGRSTACLGMTVMYRYRTLHVSSVEGVLPPISAFSRTADRNIVDHVNLDMNEDQGMTTFIMRAGHDTRTSLITRFYTFAPENLAELLGQRRRWQAGFLVGLPYQMLGVPSPYFHMSRARWLMACVLTSGYVTMLLMPGTIGFGFSFMFDQAYLAMVDLVGRLGSETAECGGGPLSVGSADIPSSSLDHDGMSDCGSGVVTERNQDERLARQALFAACCWVFWLAFMASTIGRAPKKVRGRCQFFFATACVVTTAVTIGAALASSWARIALAALVGWNTLVGLTLTYDVREWPHRLQEVLFYCVFVGIIKPMITMYAVANIDSALWGTRSIGDVKNAFDDDNALTTSASDTDSNIDSNCDPDGDIEMSTLACSRGEQSGAPGAAAVSAAVVAGGSEDEEAAPGQHPDMEGFKIQGYPRESQTRANASLHVEGEGGARELRKMSAIGLPSLRAWKFVLLVTWVSLNIGVTAVFVRWRLLIVLGVGIVVNITGQTLVVVAAWMEMNRQRRTALLPLTPASYRFADVSSQQPL